MKASLYESMSNEQSVIELENGKSIKKSLPYLNYENTIIIVNGKLTHENYIVQEKDIIIIRVLPGAATTVLAAGLITLAVVTVAAGIVGGITIYKQKEAMKKAEKELEKMKKLSSKPELDNRPFLRGASNTLATGNSQPYIIGKHFFTPYLLCKPFYELAGIDGEQQYIYLILECGFNKQVFKSVSIDDISIKNFSGDTPQQGLYSIESSLFSEDGLLEISQNGKMLETLQKLNYKVVSTTVNDEIIRDIEIEKHPESKKHLIYSLDPHAMSVDIAISFPRGLYAFDNDGDKIKTKITITPQYSTDGGNSWIDFTFNNNGVMSNTFEYLISTKELRYSAHHDFNAQDYKALKHHNQKAILIRLCSNGNQDSHIKNDCYCLYYQSTCFDPNKSTDEKLMPCKVIEDRERAFCTIMGVRLKSSKANEEKLKKINIITQGIARVWDGSRWSIDKIPTQNPAAWALEIETSPIHPASRYDDSELDLESFGDFYEYCKANRFNFNWVITQNAKKDDVLAHIMDACGACLYTDIYGRRAVAIDRKQENALAVYNPQNIIKLQNKKSLTRKTDGLRIKYTNSKDDLYQEDTYIVMREENGKAKELTSESLIKDVTVTGITEHEHIVKYARRLMAIEALRPKVTTIEVGNEGVFYTPMSKVLIQDDSLKIGLAHAVISGCIWKSGRLKKIILDGTVPISNINKAYGVIINCFTQTGGMPIAVKVEAEKEGDTNELTVLSSIRISDDAKPEIGNILSFGELDNDGNFTRITTPYIINNIRRSEKGFTLELVNYHEAIYDCGVIPKYESNMTRRQGTTPPPIPHDYGVTHEELQKSIANIDGTKAAQEAADLIVHGVRFSDTHRIRDIDFSLQDIIKKIDEDAYNAGASIERSQEHILLKVQDNDEKTRAFIAITKKGILQQVEDNKNSLKSYIDVERDQILQKTEDLKRELTGLLAVQAGAVKAMVEGGGAAGQLALSLELPAMIDKATRKKFAEKCGEAETAAVYGVLADSGYYAIKGNASNAAIKKLWDKAVKTGLLASQIQLNANQIVVQNGDKVAAAFIDGKLRAACIDAENLIVQQLKIDSDKQSNQDFEAYFDKSRGLQIRNKGADILKIDPKTGEAFFTGKVQAGAVELADKGVFIRNGEISIENKGWRGVLRPCNNGVELAILGGDGGNMTKKQLWTYISGGILNLFVLGSITSCGGMYKSNPVDEMVQKNSGLNTCLYKIQTLANHIIIFDDTFSFSNESPAYYTISSDGAMTWKASKLLQNGNVIQTVANDTVSVIQTSETEYEGQAHMPKSYNRIYAMTKDSLQWQLSNLPPNYSIDSVYGTPILLTVQNKFFIKATKNDSLPVWLSSNDGMTWTECTTIPNTISFLSGFENTLIGTVNKGVMVSNDNGITWAEKLSNLEKLNVLLSPNNNLYCFYIKTGNTVYSRFKSTDGGQHWNETQTTLASNTFENQQIVSWQVLNNLHIIYSFDLIRGYIWTSLDDGISWNKVFTFDHKKLDSLTEPLNPFNLIRSDIVVGDSEIACFAPASFYGKNCDVLFMSKDNGITWKEYVLLKQQDNYSSNYITKVQWIKDKWLAITSNGTIYTSVNAVKWQ